MIWRRGAATRVHGCVQRLVGLKLQREWSTDASRSFMVGDRDSDVEAAIAAGLPGFKFTGGNLLDFLRRSVPLAQRTQAIRAAGTKN